MNLGINEVVRLLEDIPSAGIYRGSIGVVVAVFSEPEEAYEVEFCDGDGASIAQIALRPAQFEVMRR
ncbi:DUF4926 domain-containing protein [Stenotrophomonas maltophilia]|uniref:DUF4926 domain-containing protein n=1 Tax=Stenotrophomonas maltophilia TaxID=40324 RepID=UPI0002C533DB|nr:DUF4926 domain-containing protein [Stenotrophomonas maltophilia]MBN5145121.1 DUF4926 domain-containing protein [Stenotrophomonas maltophilia]QGL78103.1 DUF4926 domain-containing protein [Stenotrophomonas maltophilia]CCP19096.1 hypothetical protein predicted by Glimmer/Critica [Stenotrophomonas maltophilia RA8]